MLAAPPNKGEYYLTDALQYMVDHGARIKVVDVRGWFDAGKLDTLLETNHVMLDVAGRDGHVPYPARRSWTRSTLRMASR